MTIYTTTSGQGPELFLIHGWGLNSAVWDELLPDFNDHFRVTTVDLPGHGKSPLTNNFDLHTVTRALLDVAPKRAHWLGWSLGGLLGMSASLIAPARVKSLICVTASARFSATQDWPGIDPQVLEQFGHELQDNFRNTLTRFLSLQVHGAAHARETLRHLRNNIFQHGEPNPEALKGGFKILSEIDIRNELRLITCPTLLLFGHLDTQTPAGVAEKMSRLLSDCRTHIFDHAAHAPFISHRVDFVNEVTGFLNDIEAGQLE